MNKKKWKNSEIPLSILCLKLCEEAAEVGLEVTDAANSGVLINTKRMEKELDHVEFIAGVIRERIGKG